MRQQSRCRDYIAGLMTYQYDTWTFGPLLCVGAAGDCLAACFGKAAPSPSTDGAAHWLNCTANISLTIAREVKVNIAKTDRIPFS
jgi:hypothetical protein